MFQDKEDRRQNLKKDAKKQEMLFSHKFDITEIVPRTAKIDFKPIGPEFS